MVWERYDVKSWFNKGLNLQSVAYVHVVDEDVVIDEHGNIRNGSLADDVSNEVWDINNK